MRWNVAAARHQPFKVIDMRWFQNWARPADCDYRSCPATEWGRDRGFHLRLPGFSSEPSAGNIVAAPPSALNCKKLLRPRTEMDLEGNRYIANLLAPAHPNPLNRTLRPKRSTQWQNFPSCKYCHGLPTQTVCNSLDALLLQVRDTDLMWIVGLRLETKSAWYGMM